MSTRRWTVSTLAVLAAVGLSAARPAAAQTYGESYTFGIGLEVGEPLGATIKWLIADGHALQGVIGFDLAWRDGFLTALDWVWHPLIIVSPTPFELSFHVGAGLFLGAWYDRHWGHGDCHWDPALHDYVNCGHQELGFGAHFPVGLDFLFKAVPIELSLEFAPWFWFYPWWGGFDSFSAQGGVIGRYFF